MNALRPSRQLELTNRLMDKTFAYLWSWMNNGKRVYDVMVMMQCPNY